MQHKQQYGITPPISTDEPTLNDISLTKQLVDFLLKTNFFEPEEESIKREIVLGHLDAMVKLFVTKMGIEQGMPEDIATEAGGKIFTFGSYRLGVHNRGADIDTLCVVPRHVTRTDFFTVFYEMLKETPQVTELTQVPDAYVPIMKLVYDDIHIDLLFARLNLSILPDDLDLRDHTLLRGIDEKCILSLNGSRTTDEILSLVPDINTFHTSLRCIKLWAKRRALYNNAMGYVGGVACAILVARICQLYPNAAASKIISAFFGIYRSWEWPLPITLKPYEDFSMNLKVWNPKIHSVDRTHKMPVITPAYPSMCSTHNVSNSTLRSMTLEFDRGRQVLDKIEQGQSTWQDLFDPSDFFYRYKQYLQVVAISTSEQNAVIWNGFLQSRIRLFVSKIEQQTQLKSVPPYPDVFEYKIKASSVQELLNQLIYPGIIPQDDQDLVEYHVAIIYIGLEVAPSADRTQTGPRRLNLSLPVTEFKTMMMSWEKKQPDMELYIRDLKRANLMDQVFDGRPRPDATDEQSRVKRELDQHESSDRKITKSKEYE